MPTERSTEQNKVIVRRIYDELWNERKLEVAEELISEDGRNYDTGITPQPFEPEQMKGTVEMIGASFPDHHKVEDLVAREIGWVAHVTLAATHQGPFMGIPPTGRKIEVTEIQVYRLKEGKAVEHRVGRDDLGAMRQLGVIADAVPAPGSAGDAAAKAID